MATSFFSGFYDNEQPFMTCILKVNYESPTWGKAVRDVLRTCTGVRSFKMDEYGRVEVSGTVDPSLLLKRLAKAGRGTRLCWIQSGHCSSNLFIPDHPRCDRDTCKYFPFRGGCAYGNHHQQPYGCCSNSGYLQPPLREESPGCCSVM